MVTTRTKIEPLTPPAALMQLCPDPALRRTARVRDITDNNITLRNARDNCAASMECLVWWIERAAKLPVTARCERDGV